MTQFRTKFNNQFFFLIKRHGEILKDVLVQESLGSILWLSSFLQGLNLPFFLSSEINDGDNLTWFFLSNIHFSVLICDDIDHEWKQLWFDIAHCLFVCPTMVTPFQISTFFNKYRHKSPILTQYHHISTSTTLYWPSSTKYQPIPPSTDPVPSYVIFKCQTFLCPPEMSTVVY